jgi:hypothetical protein
MSFLRQLALAHQKHEGFFAPGQHPQFPNGTVAFLNNNPGNLRYTVGQRVYYGAVPGLGSFSKFPSYEVGLRALMDDIRLKITGQAGSVKRYMDKHRKDYLDLAFLDYISIYAPAEDRNDPLNYTKSLVSDLQKFNVAVDTPLFQLARLIRGEIPAIDQPTQYKPIPPEIRLRGLYRRLGNTTDPATVGLINFVIKRLEDRLRS